MPILASYNNCTGCGACASACSVDAIVLDYDKNGHLMPTVDKDKCVSCFACEKVCPVNHSDKIVYSDARMLQSFTAWSINKELCRFATSGGVFAQLAHDFLLCGSGYYVYGAELSNHNTCSHVEISNTRDLKRVIGTKYLQSNTFNAFKKIKMHLKNNEHCMFCGTPCQVAGLLRYLGQSDTSNLLTLDLVCHGCPSKMLTDLTCLYYNADHILSFRDKHDGWHKGFSLTLVDNRGDRKTVSGSTSVFAKGFGGSDRPSCYQCLFSRIERVSDITLGDQWGLYDEYPHRRQYGASLVLCNTTKGLSVLTNAKGLEKERNSNVRLNQQALFLPRKGMNIGFSEKLYLLKRLPLWMQVAFISYDYKKIPFMIPIKFLKKWKHKKFLRELNSEIRRKRKELSWI